MWSASGISIPGSFSISPPSLFAQRMSATVSGRSGGIARPDKASALAQSHTTSARS